MAPTTTAPAHTIENGVVSTVVSHETTQNITVWAPEASGSWPVVYAIPGQSGDRTRWDLIGPALAGNGAVVFATDSRAEYSEKDGECGYRYALSIAAEFGGDVDQPVTMIGHSAGATSALYGGLTSGIYGPGGAYRGCFEGAARPDVIVAIAGCHYEFQGQQSIFADAWAGGWPGRANLEADLVLITGTDDDICEMWQSEDAAEALRSAGYTVDLVTIADADHMTLIFHDLADGALADGALADDEVVTVPDNPVGDQVVQTILGAIKAAKS
jgi:alpha-beta hydrolase superfamily lysophospholipase